MRPAVCRKKHKLRKGDWSTRRRLDLPRLEVARVGAKMRDHDFPGGKPVMLDEGSLRVLRNRDDPVGSPRGGCIVKLSIEHSGPCEKLRLEHLRSEEHTSELH